MPRSRRFLLQRRKAIKAMRRITTGTAAPAAIAVTFVELSDCSLAGSDSLGISVEEDTGVPVELPDDELKQNVSEEHMTTMAIATHVVGDGMSAPTIPAARRLNDPLIPSGVRVVGGGPACQSEAYRFDPGVVAKVTIALY